MRSKLTPLLHVLIVFVSLAVLSYGLMHRSVTRRLFEAQRLHAEASPLDPSGKESALRTYEALSLDLGGSRWKKALFGKEYAASLTPRLVLLYELQRYDDAIELADTLIQAKAGDVAAYYFWSGNALFQKGMTEDAGEEPFRWFNRSIGQLRKALEEDQSARWNIRYNYELIKTSVEDVMSDEKPADVKILRPRESQQQGPQKKITG